MPVVPLGMGVVANWRVFGGGGFGRTFTPDWHANCILRRVMSHARWSPNEGRVRPVIGRLEYVTLPSLGVRVSAKIDTGARSSCLHAADIACVGRDILEFRVPDVMPEEERVRARLSRRGHVRSSNGSVERRWFVELEVGIGPYSDVVEVSLTDRSTLRFPMLLGRSALRGRFLVDVARKFTLSDPRSSAAFFPTSSSAPVLNQDLRS